MFLPVNLYSLGITTIQKMRLMHLSMIVLTDLVYLAISTKIIKKRIWVILSLIIYIFWQIYLEGHVLWIESFITPLLLIGFLMMLRYEEKRDPIALYTSAFVVGISAVFKQTVAPLILLIFFYLSIKKTGFRRILMTFFIASIPIIFVLIYFSKLGVINDFFYWTITFNLSMFAQMGKTYPTIAGILKIMPIFGVSILMALISYIKREKRFHILTIFFLVGALFFAYARFDFIHLQPALPFSILILIAFLGNIRPKVLFPVIIIYLAFSLYIFIPNFKFNSKPGVSPMFNDPVTLDLIKKVNFYRKNNKIIFASGTYPHIYYLTGTMPPSDMLSFQFPWFMKVNEEKILTGIIESPPCLVVQDKKSEVGGYMLSEYMQNITKYIDSNYKVIDKVQNIEILLKK
jgi:hypothetical protein